MQPLSRRQMMAAGLGSLPLFAMAASAAEPEPQEVNREEPLLVACLLMMGHKQIEVCRFAQTKIQTDVVKQFAQAEIEEHEGMQKKLNALGYKLPTGKPPAEGEKAIGWTIGRYALSPAVSKMLYINQEVLEECIKSTRAEQEKLQGNEFEQNFIGSQLGAHYALHDHVVVYRRYATAQTAPLFDEAKGVIEKHLAQAKEIMAQLDKAKS